ncbi:MAG: helix-turn-helix transcriptional regulator [Pirellulales bacterium]
MTTAAIRSEKNHTAAILADNVRIFLEIKSAYEGCDDAIKEAVNDMVEIAQDQSATEEERERALYTIVEALFPSLSVDFMAFCERVRKSDGALENARAMADEEKTFAERVQEILTERQITQEQLAEMIGVGQPAICNMLNRNCRPQKRTIVKIAEALKVSPEYIWPNFKK